MIDAGDALSDPLAARAVWDGMPGSLQTKIANDFLLHPIADPEARYKRLKARSTLHEASHLDRLMAVARKGK
jgi:hypothetical protein